MLVETFVETRRCTGAVHPASSWIHVGTAYGRERYDRDKLQKDVWLRLLSKDRQRTLSR